MAVGLGISVVATIGQGTVSTVLFAVGFLLLLGGMVLLDSVRRR